MITYADVSIPMTVQSDSAALAVSMDLGYVMEQNARYEGEYVFTPTQETQVIPSANLVMSADVTINPIPQNYGLITWDGSVLTVS